MSTSYPNSLDSLTNPTASDSQATVSHSAQHANANDAIEALEAKVGINSSAVTTSLDYRVTQLEENPVSAVTSVNGQDGVVVLDADDLDDTSTTNKFTNATDIARLANTSGTNTGDQNLTAYFNKSTDDLDDITDGTTYKKFSATEQTKLSGIAAGAEVNVNADWNAVSGDAQILNKPSIPTQYTDELAQDAVGGMVADTTTIDLTYTDATPELKADVKTASISNSLLANMAQNTIKGRITASTGVPEDLTAANVRTIINVADGATAYTDELAQDAVGNAVGNGLDYDDASGAISVDETELAHNSLGSKQGGTTNEYYHITAAQATVVANTSGINTGDQTLPVKASGAELDTGTDDVKFATAKAIKDSHNVPSVAPGTSGNLMTSNGTDWTSAAPPVSVSVTTKGDLQTYSTTPDRLPIGTDGQVLKANSATATGLEWGAISGSGDVVGPASSTNSNVALFDGTTGKLLKDGGKGIPTGDIVGTSDTQTLTNKTLTSPKLNENVALTSTSTELNALDGKTGAWDSYTPSLGASTNLGSTGTASGKYIQIGKIVHWRAVLSPSGTGVSAGSGQYDLSMPVTVNTTPGFQQTGTGWLYTGGTFKPVTVDNGRLIFTSNGAVVTNANSGMVAGDVLSFGGAYEAA